MSATMAPPSKSAEQPVDPIAESVPPPVAERVSGFCDKSLKRWSEAGEKVGRFTVGRAVRYHLPTLKAWLASKAASSTSPAA